MNSKIFFEILEKFNEHNISEITQKVCKKFKDFMFENSKKLIRKIVQEDKKFITITPFKSDFEKYLNLNLENMAQNIEIDDFYSKNLNNILEFKDELIRIVKGIKDKKNNFQDFHSAITNKITELNENRKNFKKDNLKIFEICFNNLKLIVQILNILNDEYESKNHSYYNFCVTWLDLLQNELISVINFSFFFTLIN